MSSASYPTKGDGTRGVREGELSATSYPGEIGIM